MIDRRDLLAGMAVGGVALAACKPGANDTEGSTTVATAPTPKGRPLSESDLFDALTGSSYLGTGGGGSLAEARQMIRDGLAEGLSFSMLPVAQLPDTARVACPYGLGSIAPGSDVEDPAVPFPVQNAFELLQDHVGQAFAAVILGEIGPGSLADGLLVAARLGVPALDADTVGRAVPEINQHSVKVSGTPLTPVACVTQQGDEIILRDVLDPARPEAVLRAVAASSGVVGVVDSPITGAQAKTPGVLVTDSLTLAMSIGRAVREAKRDGSNPIEAARVAGDGYLLFKGTVSQSDWRDDGGFLEGTVDIAGTGAFAGQALRSTYKNEHLIARRDGKVIATSPDLIQVIDDASADGIDNPDFTVGQAVTVLGFRSDPLWRTEGGLAVFGPRYFGYDVDYLPIETRLGE